MELPLGTYNSEGRCPAEHRFQVLLQAVSRVRRVASGRVAKKLVLLKLRWSVDKIPRFSGIFLHHISPLFSL
jgi:hypothetical protein